MIENLSAHGVVANRFSFMRWPDIDRRPVHRLHEHGRQPMPNDADLLDLLLDWAPDPADRQRILVDNPAERFGFPLE